MVIDTIKHLVYSYFRNACWVDASTAFSSCPICENNRRFVFQLQIIMFARTSAQHEKAYQQIVESIILLKGSAAKKACDLERHAGITADYYKFDEENPWAQPLHYCLSDRIRDGLIKITD